MPTTEDGECVPAAEQEIETLAKHDSNSNLETKHMDTESSFADQSTAQENKGETKLVPRPEKLFQKVDLPIPIRSTCNNRKIVYFVKPDGKQSGLGGKYLFPKGHSQLFRINEVSN